MTETRVQMLGMLEALHSSCTASATRFRAEQSDRIEIYRKAISQGLDTALAQLRAEMSELSAGNEIVETVGEQMSEYVGWMQWALWDLPVLAVALDADPDEFRDAVAPCGLAYISVRAFDDVIDQHFTYKGRRDTLYGTVSATYVDTQRARGLSTLAGLLLCFDGLGRLAGPSGRNAMLTGVIASLRRAVIGAMMEYTSGVGLSEDEYVRMVRLKSVDYWRVLYSAIDPDRASALHPFFERYYELAQYLNDVEDYEEDLRRGQPNLLLLRDGPGRCRRVDDPRPWAVTGEVESLIAERIVELGEAAERLPSLQRAAAETKLADLLDDAHEAGLFAAAVSTNGGPAAPTRPDLVPFSELEEVIEQAGAQALVEVPCGACGAQTPLELFRKQGFRFHRCSSCTHVYVSPRVDLDVRQAVAAAVDDDSTPDRYLDVQRIYAERICELLRRRTPGARLLDIGFGRGYLMQMAQVYGFEVHGLDSSEDRVAAMRPLFGERVVCAAIGRDAIPWRSFDVVVLSHVLEHLSDPVGTLTEIAATMNPGAWLYVAVPDVGSMDFKIFGKHWDVVNPLVHVHYFSEQSLTTALESGGFEEIERTWHPHLRDELAPRWMRLLRQLGGTDSSELTVLAKLPDDPAYFPRESAD